MAQPPFAALDPIFFSFHWYLDLLWAQWQENFDTDTDVEARLCGLFKDREHRPENRFRVQDTLDTKTQLGYVYEHTPGEQAPAWATVEATALFPAHPAFDFVVSARKKPELVRTLDVTIPEPGFENAQLLLTGVNVMTPFSYSADIYLARASEELHLEDREFRATHLADRWSDALSGDNQILRSPGERLPQGDLGKHARPRLATAFRPRQKRRPARSRRFDHVPQRSEGSVHPSARVGTETTRARTRPAASRQKVVMLLIAESSERRTKLNNFGCDRPLGDTRHRDVAGQRRACSASA